MSKEAMTDEKGRPLTFWGGKAEQPAPATELREQEPCGWQFFQDGKWHNGMEINDHRANTEAAGIPVRDVYPSPQAQPAQLEAKASEAKEQPAKDEFKAAYIEAMVASNEAGFAGMSAAETIRELSRMVAEQPAQPSKPLTDGEIVTVAKFIDIEFKDEGYEQQLDGILTFARAIEAKLKEKNT